MNPLLDSEITSFSRQIESSYGSPVLVMGMHRSGTSLVARLLRAVGGYFGSRLDPNSESLTFMRFNHTILERRGIRWDFIPHDFDAESLARDTDVLTCVMGNRHLLWSGFFETFGEASKEGYSLTPDEYRLPPAELVASPNSNPWPQRTEGAPLWGWKDPRNTLTSAVWLRLFPEARIIHVVRNGIDSALSLQRRAVQSGEGAPHCTDLGYCFDLWERYVEAGLKYRNLPEGRYLEIRYEDMLIDPVTHIGRLLSFSHECGVKAESLVGHVDHRESNPCRWDDHPELLQRAHRSDLLVGLGYGELLQDRGGKD